MKTHVFRLRRGSDLLKALQEYARTRRIAAGTVVSGVGCVTRARVRDASGVTVRELNEPLEIVSLMGTLSAARTHLHIALAREDLTVLGGHLMEGCIVNTTAEVVLLELYGVRFGAEWDGETGYDELAILSLEEQA
jgi:predicted DNA-binding protein with PD1-like motif